MPSQRGAMQGHSGCFPPLPPTVQAACRSRALSVHPGFLAPAVSPLPCAAKGSEVGLPLAVLPRCLAACLVVSLLPAEAFHDRLNHYRLNCCCCCRWWRLCATVCAGAACCRNAAVRAAGRGGPQGPRDGGSGGRRRRRLDVTHDTWQMTRGTWAYSPWAPRPAPPATCGVLPMMWPAEVGRGPMDSRRRPGLVRRVPRAE